MTVSKSSVEFHILEFKTKREREITWISSSPVTLASKPMCWSVYKIFEHIPRIQSWRNGKYLTACCYSHTQRVRSGRESSARGRREGSAGSGEWTVLTQPHWFNFEIKYCSLTLYMLLTWIFPSTSTCHPPLLVNRKYIKTYTHSP